MSLDELYQEVILDHYKNPRGKCPIDCPHAACSLYNPLCGDQVDVSLSVEGQPEGCPLKVLDVGFAGHGCSISQASASMMSDLCRGKSVAEICELCMAFREFMRGNRSAEDVKDQLGDAVALEGVRKFSARVKCAMLAWEAMEKCLKQV
jgi:nitrogen fixation protein NifU and related proteins